MELRALNEEGRALAEYLQGLLTHYDSDGIVTTLESIASEGDERLASTPLPDRS